MGENTEYCFILASGGPMGIRRNPDIKRPAGGIYYAKNRLDVKLIFHSLDNIELKYQSQCNLQDVQHEDQLLTDKETYLKYKSDHPFYYLLLYINLTLPISFAIWAMHQSS